MPQGLYSVPDSGLAFRVFDLTSSTLAFDGGLAHVPASGQFYAIGNDFLGESSLVTFTLGGAGTFSNVASLGTGYLSGMTYNSADGYLYAISTDSSLTQY